MPDVTPAKHRRPALGLLFDSFQNEYSSVLVAAFDAECARRGYDLICFAGGSLVQASEAQRHRCFELVSAAAVDAVVSLSLTHVPADLETLFARFRPLPVCTVGVEVPGYPLVQVDNAMGMSDAVVHLITVHGRRKIAFLRGPPENLEAESRYQAYRDTLSEFEIPFDPARVVLANFERKGGQDAVTDLLEWGVEFDALIGANDPSALGAMSVLQERGVVVPYQVAVVGFDDSEEARGTSPMLATVRQPYWEQAARALDVITAKLEGREPESRILLPSTFIKRRSCGCLSEGAPSEAPRPLDLEAAPFEEAFAKRRPWLAKDLELVLDAARVVSVGFGERVLGAIHAAVLGASDRELLVALEEVIELTSASGGDIGVWHHQVSILRKRLLPCVVSDPERWLRFEEIWERVRMLIADAVEREQRTLRRQAERSAEILTDTSGALITSFDVESLPRSLAERLPSLEINSAFVALYQGVGMPPPASRLIVAYDEGKLAALPSFGVEFPTRELVPRSHQSARRSSRVVEPLFFENQQLGFALFELGPKRSVVFELLRELVSAALKGAELVGRVTEAANERAKGERDRLQQELEIAARIQTSILPKDFQVEGLDMAGAMLPASHAGGDYYDVLPVPGGAWIGIGDVAGHGLEPGLVMMMLQSVVAALARSNPDLTPGEMLRVVNTVLYDNIRNRMHQDEYVTLSLIHYFSNGTVLFSGAHEDMVILRQATGKCELVETPGTWVGATRDIDAVTWDSMRRLEAGDILVLYTDGVIEAANAAGEHFGIERVCQAVERAQHAPVEAIRDVILDAVQAWLSVQNDDIAVLVARHKKPAG